MNKYLSVRILFCELFYEKPVFHSRLPILFFCLKRNKENRILDFYNNVTLEIFSPFLSRIVLIISKPSISNGESSSLPYKLRFEWKKIRDGFISTGGFRGFTYLVLMAFHSPLTSWIR